MQSCVQQRFTKFSDLLIVCVGDHCVLCWKFFLLFANKLHTLTCSIVTGKELRNEVQLPFFIFCYHQVNTMMVEL